MPLAPLCRGDLAGEAVDVLQRGHAEIAEPFEQSVQDGDGRARIRERPMTRLAVGTEEAGQRRQLAVRAFILGHDLAGDPDGVQMLPVGDRVAAACARRPQEAEVEGGVVGDQDAAAGELQEGRQHGVDGRRGGDHRVGDSGQDRDERRYRCGGPHQRGHLREDLPTADLDRAEFGDFTVGGVGAGGLQVHDDEGDIPQGPAQFLEAGLPWWRPCRARAWAWGRGRRGRRRRGLVVASRRR